MINCCPWATGEDYIAYHDQEWGIACYDRQKLFEKICLEGQQAGLSWITILRKRPHYRRCFFDFQVEKVAQISDQQIDQLLNDRGLIRHRGKLTAIRTNARAWLQAEAESVDMVAWLWGFVGGQPTVHYYETMAQIPSSTPASTAMSKGLKKMGFRFVGPTTCYAFMQSMGLVNDHLIHCPRHPTNLSNKNS